MIKQYKLIKKQNNFDITLNYKGLKVKVQFSNGNTYKGIYPKCYEKDHFKQRAIEASQFFKDKEIVLERIIPEAGDQKNTVAVQTKKMPVAKAVVKNVQKPVAPIGEKRDIPVQQADPTPEPTPELTDTCENTKEFANLGEAILFVAQNFQATAKTEKEVREILKNNGINPKIKRG